ncbi:hypothetical protein AGR2A_Lc180026 [Agrobacterium genomosp. 2 str. CFBP 5494]|uniref:Uncharacterized protein n=1 Tax=Agrobacterium genomosp. 2 str. CFBP 5494 TaxID=1183436 RepID=A0A9W5F1P3_9HYPH|nr:hypothetical protein AGR2A_Lc180026 [Agrobacterium genomosp. 2 str. CFBP 5494]
MVKSLKRLKQLRTTNSFALTSSCYERYIEEQYGQNKSGLPDERFMVVTCAPTPCPTSSCHPLSWRLRTSPANRLAPRRVFSSCPSSACGFPCYCATDPLPWCRPPALTG